ncbi:PIR Superfamily Protein [Plasmodium ovale wallikeri]|uniref:PIR Superfamily Protein n=1 Tax=Plasmodium ovale wallikeri TaxID=864142 RepID=A0A1A9A559_PLAOA|nr:PIR Superfamily Protein [Plasmodium ovale wallikeri]
MKDDTLTIHLDFWNTTLRGYLETYINDNINEWSKNDNKKRCRDFNHILDIILKKIKAKEVTNPQVSYDLIKLYINNAAETLFEPWDGECERKPKFPDHSDDIENMKNIDDLCEDIAYIKEKFSEIHSNHCNKIESYINEQISNLKSIYTTSEKKYSHILGYHSFTSFNDFDIITEKLKSTCQEGATRSLLTGDQTAMSQYPDHILWFNIK